MAKEIDEAKGRVKRAAGELTGDEKLKRKGTIDKAAGKAKKAVDKAADKAKDCLLYTSPSPRDRQKSRMPSSA